MTDNPLAWALRGLLYALNEPELDWHSIEEEWLEASAAAGTAHEGAVRVSGIDPIDQDIHDRFLSSPDGGRRPFF